MPGQLQIIEPLPIVALNSSAGGDANVGNLLTPDPKEIWVASSSTGRFLNFDLGSAFAVDTLYLGGTNASGAETIRLYTATDVNGTGRVDVSGQFTLREPDTLEARPSGFIQLGAPVTSRYWSVQLANPTVPFQAGVLLVGKAFSAEWDREWGSGRRLVDTGKVTQLQGGGFGAQDGARKAAYSWTFGDLTDAETETLWGIVTRLGISSPLLVNERQGAASNRAERRHYGLFRRIDQFERRDPQATKWSLEIEEWI